MAGPTVCLLLLLLTAGVAPRSTRGTDHTLDTLAQRHRQHRHSPTGGPVVPGVSLDRQKQLRKNHIKQHIETSLNWRGKQMPTASQVKATLAQLPETIIPTAANLAPSPLSGGFVERLKNFYPLCIDKISTKLLRQLPAKPDMMALFFQLELPTAQPGSKLKLIEAKLMLQKLVPTSALASPLRLTVSMLSITPNGFTEANAVILDTLMVRDLSPGWVELDVTGAVNAWQKRRSVPGTRGLSKPCPGALMVEVEEVDPLLRPVPAASILQGSVWPAPAGPTAAEPTPMVPPPAPPVVWSPIIRLATLEIPLGQEEPTNLTLFGLKKSSLDPSLVGSQDLEIRHGAREQVVRSRQGGQGDTLVTLEEVDYLPLGPAPPLPSPGPLPRGEGGPRPIATRMIMSREELTRLLVTDQQEQQQQQQQERDVSDRLEQLSSRQEEDSEMLKRILMNLMTESENRRVFGQAGRSRQAGRSGQAGD